MAEMILSVCSGAADTYPSRQHKRTHYLSSTYCTHTKSQLIHSAVMTVTVLQGGSYYKTHLVLQVRFVTRSLAGAGRGSSALSLNLADIQWCIMASQGGVQGGAPDRRTPRWQWRAATLGGCSHERGHQASVSSADAVGGGHVLPGHGLPFRLAGMGSTMASAPTLGACRAAPTPTPRRGTPRGKMEGVQGPGTACPACTHRCGTTCAPRTLWSGTQRSTQAAPSRDLTLGVMYSPRGRG